MLLFSIYECITFYVLKRKAFAVVQLYDAFWFCVNAHV